MHTKILPIIKAAKQGNTKPFNDLFKDLYKESRIKLLSYASCEADAEDAFAQAMSKFWETFVVNNKALPDSNIKGYIFTMAKFNCIDKHRAKKNLKVVSRETLPLNTLAIGTASENEESDFFKTQALEKNYKTALTIAIGKLSEKCCQLFNYILENGIDKPRDIYQPLGYKNAATLRVIKSKCFKKLKIKTVLELENMIEKGHQSKINYGK